VRDRPRGPIPLSAVTYAVPGDMTFISSEGVSPSNSYNVLANHASVNGTKIGSGVRDHLPGPIPASAVTCTDPLISPYRQKEFHLLTITKYLQKQRLSIDIKSIKRTLQKQFKKVNVNKCRIKGNVNGKK